MKDQYFHGFLSVLSQSIQYDLTYRSYYSHLIFRAKYLPEMTHHFRYSRAKRNMIFSIDTQTDFSKDSVELKLTRLFKLMFTYLLTELSQI